MNIDLAIQNLRKHGFVVRYFASGEEAAETLASELKGQSVGIGGCMTAKQIGLYDLLIRESRVSWHWTDPDRIEAQQRAAESDVYILSANALSETGEIVNIDGNGNRLASMLYGHRRVIFLIGVNKLTPDLPSAIDRARNVASPLNARRLMRKTPCALTEPMRCYDCTSPERICSGMTILYQKMGSIPEMDVFLIGEALGY